MRNIQCLKGDHGFGGPPVVLAICGGVLIVWFIFSGIMSHIQYNHAESRRKNLAAFEEARVESIKKRMPRQPYKGQTRNYKVSY